MLEIHVLDRSEVGQLRRHVVPVMLHLTQLFKRVVNFVKGRVYRRIRHIGVLFRICAVKTVRENLVDDVDNILTEHSVTIFGLHFQLVVVLDACAEVVEKELFVAVGK